MLKLLWTSLLALQFLTELPVTTMSVDGSELVKSFNRAQDRVRVVTIMSPT